MYLIRKRKRKIKEGYKEEEKNKHQQKKDCCKMN